MPLRAKIDRTKALKWGRFPPLVFVRLSNLVNWGVEPDRSIRPEVSRVTDRAIQKHTVRLFQPLVAFAAELVCDQRCPHHLRKPLWHRRHGGRLTDCA